jgi:hypothetical protein
MGHARYEAAGMAPSDIKVAEILGLTLDEYAQLSHSGLRELSDNNGEVYQYYMMISPLNAPEVLAKLNMNKKRVIYFPPDIFGSRTTSATYYTR